MQRAAHSAFIACLLLSELPAEAQWIKWTDATKNHDWANPANWLPSREPTKNDDGVDLASLPGPIIAHSSGAVKSFVNIGTGGDAMLTIGPGGRLTAKVAMSLGCADGVAGTLVMAPGSHLQVDQLYVGNGGASYGGKGRLILNGGTIHCTYFSVLRARALKSEAHVTLNAGVVNCWDFIVHRDSIVPPTIDIHKGKLVQRRNDLARIKQWVHSKWIVGFGGKGDVHVVFDTPEHPECTVVWATPRPKQPPTDSANQPRD